MYSRQSPIGWSKWQSINHSINQSLNQSLNQSVKVWRLRGSRVFRLTRFQKRIGCWSTNSDRLRQRSPSWSRTFSSSLRRTSGLRYGTVIGSNSTYLRTLEENTINRTTTKYSLSNELLKVNHFALKLYIHRCKQEESRNEVLRKGSTNMTRLRNM